MLLRKTRWTTCSYWPSLHLLPVVTEAWQTYSLPFCRFQLRALSFTPSRLSFTPRAQRQLINFLFYSEMNCTIILQGSYPNIHELSTWLLLIKGHVLSCPKQCNIIERIRTKSLVCFEEIIRNKFSIILTNRALPTQAWKQAADRQNQNTIYLLLCLPKNKCCFKAALNCFKSVLFNDLTNQTLKEWSSHRRFLPDKGVIDTFAIHGVSIDLPVVESLLTNCKSFLPSPRKNLSQVQTQMYTGLF